MNEDAKAALDTIDPASGTITTCQFSGGPLGSGYDDLAFVNGRAFVVASNPTLNAAGINFFPAIDSVVLKGTTAVVTPVLLGNATALDVTTKAAGALNLVDPDSLTVDPTGNLGLVDLGGAQIVSIGQPGTPKQTVTRLPVGTQLDDTVWATAKSGRLFAVAAKRTPSTSSRPRLRRTRSTRRRRTTPGWPDSWGQWIQRPASRRPLRSASARRRGCSSHPTRPAARPWGRQKRRPVPRG